MFLTGFLSTLIESIAELIVQIIKALHLVTRTYSIDIILLTLLVRVLTSGVYKKQAQMQTKMAKVQPIIKEIQEKFKDDPQEMNKRVWAVYKEHNIDLFGGCLPMLFQMPVLIALFYVLRIPKYYKQLPGFEQAHFLGAKLTIKTFESAPFPDVESLSGMIDLHRLFKIPFFLDKFLYLPALPLFLFYIITTILQFRQSQMRNPSSQSNQMAMMLPLFLIFGLIFPSGLLLYFGLTNVFQMQLYRNVYKALKVSEAKKEEQSGTDGNGVSAPPPPPKKRKKKRHK
jgi:YidC/Oxa1 family membrane protein insertase